jgi:hypothetical protein
MLRVGAHAVVHAEVLFVVAAAEVEVVPGQDTRMRMVSPWDGQNTDLQRLRNEGRCWIMCIGMRRLHTHRDVVVVVYLAEAVVSTTDILGQGECSA